MSGDAETSSLNTPEAWSQRAQATSPHEAVMWSPEGQAERFAAVLAALDPQEHESFLDFGCGTGALSRFLFEGTYVGYDWSFPMARRATDEHPGYRFVSTLPWSNYDLVACIGTFNLPGSYKETWQTMHSLWDRTNRALAASLYYGEDNDCLRYDEYDLCDFARDRARLWRVEKIRHNDLMLVMWR